MKHLLKVFLCCSLILLVYGNAWAQDNTSDADKRASDAEKVQRNAGTNSDDLFITSPMGQKIQIIPKNTNGAFWNPATGEIFTLEGVENNIVIFKKGDTEYYLNLNENPQSVNKILPYLSFNQKNAPLISQLTTDPLILQTNDPKLRKATETLASTFKKIRIIVYMLGGFGFIGFAVAAIFGKLSWSWLVMITISLFVLASTEAIVLYAIGAGGGKPEQIKSTWASTQFNKGTSDQLKFRDDSNDFNYDKMLEISKKAVKSTVK